MERAGFPNTTTYLTAAALVALPLMLPSMSLAIEILIFATGALSAILLLGSVGLLSFGQGLYFGVGAYTCGILLRDVGAGHPAGIVLAVLVTALIAIPIGWLIVRRRGVYFVMLTFALAQFGFFAMHAMGHITGGENGFSNVPRPVFFEGNLQASTLALYVLFALLFFLAFLVIQRVKVSPFGSVLTAIRNNEDRAEALGYNTRRFKLVAFVLASAIAGLAGTMNTLFLGFVPPSAIELEKSERLLVIALIGGVGSPGGALLGSGFYMILADVLGQFWSRWMMIIAVTLILIVLYFNDGLLGGIVRANQFIRRRIGNDDATGRQGHHGPLR